MAFMRRLLLRLFLPLCLLSLCSCIVVENFSEYWNKGFIDNCANEIMRNNSDHTGRHTSRNSTALMRSLRLGNHTFLMVREKPQDKGGNLIRYEIHKNTFILYRLNESKRADFLRDYPDSGVVLTSETATIPILNKESAALLSQVADDASYWMESRREPYNLAHSPDCIQTLY
jgi:hypothetical protein